MTEAIFGLIGVLVGSGISWLQTYWISKRAENKNARYLAIRMVCVLDNYLQACTDVVKDDGLSFGQRTPEGCLEPQVKSPGPPIFPEDVDWKTIDHELVYKILSFPAEVEAAERMIKSAWEFAYPPDFADGFIERKYHYCLFGLMAYMLSQELSKKYRISPMVYKDWDPVADLKNELEVVTKKRDLRFKQHVDHVNRELSSK